MYGIVYTSFIFFIFYINYHIWWFTTYMKYKYHHHICYTQYQKLSITYRLIYLGLSPLPATVTTRIITSLVGNPYKPSFATVTGQGDTPLKGEGSPRVDWNPWFWHWNASGTWNVRSFLCNSALREITANPWVKWFDLATILKFKRSQSTSLWSYCKAETRETTVRESELYEHIVHLRLHLQKIRREIGRVKSNTYFPNDFFRCQTNVM